MRRLVLAVMAIAAIGFTSCNGSKTGQGPAIDSTSIIGTTDATEQATVEADNLTAELAEKIAANNPEAVQAIIEKAKEKIAEFLAKGDTEAANIYQEKISTFLTENADKIKAVVGEENETVNTLINAITSAPAAAAAAVEGAAGAVEEAAGAAKDEAQKKVDEAVDAQKKKAAGAIDDAANDAKKRLGL